MKYTTTLILLLLIVNQVAAQPSHPKKKDRAGAISIDNADDNSDENNDTKKAYFSLGANYLSNNVYLGRKDSILVPYISPYAGYYFKSGIYFRGIGSYQTSSANSHFDLFTIEAGYSHLFWNSLSMSTAFDKYFFSQNSNSVKANIKSSAVLSLLYMNDYVEPIFMGTVDFTGNKKADIVLSFGIDHTFFLLNDKMAIIPTITANVGTQNYYNEYVIGRETKRGYRVLNRQPVNKTNQFDVLDYELSLQVQYKKGKWVWLFVPTYAIPMNPSGLTLTTMNSITGKTNTITESEKISNSFFVELDVSHRFYRKAKRATGK